jgi:hypothetical protein
MAVAGDRHEAVALIARLEATARHTYVPGYHLALAHAGLDNRDRAFEQLARAAEDRDPSLVDLSVEPRFEPLRRDQRYASFLSTHGLAFRR